jgi:hypothetical protein
LINHFYDKINYIYIIIISIIIQKMARYGWKGFDEKGWMGVGTSGWGWTKAGPSGDGWVGLKRGWAW